MTELLAPVAGGLFAAGTYLVLRRTLLQVILGLALLSNAVNLVILSAAGVDIADPPIVPEGSSVLGPSAADPVPQALVLTAIVISFGVIAFFIVLADRVYRSTGVADIDELTTTDRLEYIAPANSDGDHADPNAGTGAH